jgi:hypothetical protein
VDNICKARSFVECPLASIQFAVSQFEQMMRAQAGKEPAQVLLCAVLSQAVLDSLHMREKVKGQFNQIEAREFLDSKYAKSTCEIIGIDYDWFHSACERFINAVKSAGLKSKGNPRLKKGIKTI